MLRSGKKEMLQKIGREKKRKSKDLHHCRGGLGGKHGDYLPCNAQVCISPNFSARRTERLEDDLEEPYQEGLKTFPVLWSSNRRSRSRPYVLRSCGLTDLSTK